MITLEIDVEPMAVQSVRSSIVKGKIFHYQPPKVHAWKEAVALLARAQLPASFEPFNKPIAVGMDFIFPIGKTGWHKETRRKIENGWLRYKDGKPDLLDNLPKATADALNGILWTDDRLIVKNLGGIKVYGKNAMIRVRVEEVETQWLEPSK